MQGINRDCNLGMKQPLPTTVAEAKEILTRRVNHECVNPYCEAIRVVLKELQDKPTAFITNEDK